MPAPVALFVFNRPDHTRRTLAALAANRQAAETDVVVFCDGPRTLEDSVAVAQVRAIVAAAAGAHRSLRMVERDDNIGLAGSIIAGVTEVVREHGRIIVLEDDIVTHPGALAYFNTLLDHFAGNRGVFSISGFTYPEGMLRIPDDYEFDVYAIPRMQCWGWATWADRWEMADWQVGDFAAFDASPAQTSAYARRIGPDSLATLRSWKAANRDIWACRWVFAHFKHNAVCICPTRSYVDNIGLDGSGANCNRSPHLANDLTTPRPDAPRLPVTAFVDERIHRAFMDIVAPKPPPAPSPSPPPPPSLGDRLIKAVEDWSERRHQAFLHPSPVPLVRLGTPYGGWWVPSQGLGPDDTVLSAGAGEDISFDIELARRFGCRVILLDPTPRAERHFAETGEAIRAGGPAPINGDRHCLYPADPVAVDRLAYRSVGLFDRNAVLRFHPPANAKHVSHSLGNLQGTEGGFEAQCVSLEEVLRRENLPAIRLLKMDIEGAEFAVLKALLAGTIRPDWLLVEFHAGRDRIEKRTRLRTLAMVRALAHGGYRLVRRDGWDYVFAYTR